MTGGCYDAITGQPVPCPPPASGLPGGWEAPPAGGARPDELPFPAPSNLIPNPGVPSVPYAPPSAAPGFGANPDPRGNATVVKNGTKQ